MMNEPAPPELTRVPARSRRQAMDWSLVLASQGIEAVIDPPPSMGQGWGLLVPPEAFEQAKEAIRLYRLENRRWNLQTRVPGTSVLFDWTSIAWVLLISFFFLLTTIQPELSDLGLMNGAKVAAGQWWRLFTAIWLHADVSHLAANATLGLIFLGLTMSRYGPGIGLLGSYLAGGGGNLAVLLLWHGQSSLGASGMVLGNLGFLAADTLTLRARSPSERKVMVVSLCAGVMLFVLLGLSPESDWRAHLGGFISGIAIGGLVRISSSKQPSASVNWVAGLLFALLVILPWVMALRASH